MTDRSNHGEKLMNQDLEDPDSCTFNHGDRSDIFYSANSSTRDTTETDHERAGHLTEVEALWRQLQQTTIRSSNDHDNVEKKTPEEYFDNPNILKDIQHRTSSQLPRWSETVENQIQYTALPELPLSQDSSSLMLEGLCNRDPPVFGPSNCDPTVFGPSNRGPTVFGPLNRGPTVFGSSNSGPTVYGGSSNRGPTVNGGSSNRGPTVYAGSSNYGPTVYGSSNRGPTVFGPSNRDPTVFRSSNRGPTVLGSSNRDPTVFASPNCDPTVFVSSNLSVTEEEFKSSHDFDMRQYRLSQQLSSSSSSSSSSSNPTSPREKIVNRFIGEQIKTASGPYPVTMEIKVKGETDNNVPMDDPTDSLNIPSMGSSGKGQTRYLFESTKPKTKIPENITHFPNPDLKEDDLPANEHNTKNPTVSEQTLSYSTPNSSVSLHKDLGKSTAKVPIYSWESHVQDNSDLKVNNLPEPTLFYTKNTTVSEQQFSYSTPKSSASRHKDLGNSTTEVDSWESPVRDNSIANKHTGSLKLIPKTMDIFESPLKKTSAETKENFSLHPNIPAISLEKSLASLTSLPGEVPPVRLSVYSDVASGSCQEASLMNMIVPNYRTQSLRQEDNLEVASMYSDRSCTSSTTDGYNSDDNDVSSSMVSFNGNIMEKIQSAQIIKINNVQNYNPQIDVGSYHLISQTEIKMEGIRKTCHFDISNTEAWKSLEMVLDTHKMAFLVGFSDSFKKMISLKFYESRKGESCRVFSDPDDWKTCCKTSEPFAIFIEEAFGHIGDKFEPISDFIKNINNYENLQAAFFMTDPLSFELNKESLKKRIRRGLRLDELVVDLEKEKYLLSFEAKREVLEKASLLVKEKDRPGLTELDINEIACIENPVFFDACEQFITFERYDKEISLFFSMPLDCLIGDIRYLKEKWPNGYYVLRLVAFTEMYDESSKNSEFSKIIDGNILQILNKFLESYLKAAIDSDEISSTKYFFRHQMMQYAVLSTESDVNFLIRHCPLGFLKDVISHLPNIREISFKDKMCVIAKRFIQEIQSGYSQKITVFDIWNKTEFFNCFTQECDKQSVVSKLESLNDFLYFSVLNKSKALLSWILKTCKDQNIKVSGLLLKKAIFASCVVGHFEHFELLVHRIGIHRLMPFELKDPILITKSDTENSKVSWEKVKCYPHIIHTAVDSNRLDVLEYLLNNGINVNYSDSLEYTSLHVACRSGSDLKVLEYLKANGGNVATVTDKWGDTCLHTACCCHGNIEIVKWLVTKASDLVLKRNESGQIPLHKAVGSGNTQIVELLMEISNKFRNDSLSDKDNYGNNVLHLACKIQNNLTMIEFLLDRRPSLISGQDCHGNTVLHVACETSGNRQVVEYLVSKGADVNSKNLKLRTPLHKACKEDNVEIVEFLLAQDNIQVSKDKEKKYPHQLSKSVKIKTILNNF